MDRRNKPTVINLAEDLKRKINVPNISINRCQESDMNADNLKFLRQGDKIEKNLYMTSEFDVELKNDFKWLINFNLRDILGCGIDDEPCGNKSKIKKKGSRKENIDRQDYRFPLIDIVEQCLVEKDGITVREIFKWISGRYPCFKTRDCKWKNFVRRSLVKNPLFKNRNSKRGRNDLWYLDRNFSEGPNLNSQQNKLSVTEGNLMNPRMHQQLGTKREITSLMFRRDKDYYPFCENTSYRVAIDDIQTSTVQLYSAENWIEMAGYQDKDYIQVVKHDGPPEYYEMQAALATEFLEENAEPLEAVSFLDENTTSISLELI